MKIKIIDRNVSSEKINLYKHVYESIKLSDLLWTNEKDQDACLVMEYNDETMEECDGKPTIVNLTSNFDKDIFNKHENIMLVRVPSLECKLKMIDDDFENNQKIVVRPNGYNQSDYNISKKLIQKGLKPKPRLRFLISYDDQNTVASSIQFIIDAFSGIPDKILDDMHLYMINEESSVTTSSYLQTQKLINPIRHKINFFYYDKEWEGTPENRVFYHSDIVLAASENFCPWNNGVLKAMACGSFPLVTTTQGVKMIMHNNSIGNVCSFDVEEFRKNIIMIYSSWKKSPEYMEKLFTKSSKIARKYTWDRYTDLLLDDLQILKEANSAT